MWDVKKLKINKAGGLVQTNLATDDEIRRELSTVYRK